MATLDFTPLYRSTVGFDHLSNLLSHALDREESNYPPYNIEKIDDDAYRIVMALAGFARSDIEVVTEQNRLYVRGRTSDKPEGTYLYRGIARRPFEHVFELADYVSVVAANMAEGVLTIDLKRELPEALKPRRIEVATPPIKLKALDDAAA